MTSAELVQRNRAALDRFLAAWATRDPDAVLDSVHQDFVYSASVGPEPGSTWRTREAIREGLKAMFAYDEGCETEISDIQIHEEVGFQTWVYRFKHEDGSHHTSYGCDLLRFKDGKLIEKNAFRKVLTPPLSNTGGESPRSSTVDVPAAVAYQPRHFEFRGVWSIRPLDVKVYGISLRESGITEETWSAARRCVEHSIGDVESTGNHHRLGFLIVHQGKDATWLLFSWWVHHDIRCQLLSVLDNGRGTFQPVDKPYDSCVWEQIVITSERDAWVDKMLCAEPSPTAYLSAALKDGTY
jgi:ketosteroid isomerase-like protein